MAMMVRYCEKHRHAWPHSDPWKGGSCPMGVRTAEMPPCPVKSVDAISLVNALARTPGMPPSPTLGELGEPAE